MKYLLLLLLLVSCGNRQIENELVVYSVTDVGGTAPEMKFMSGLNFVDMVYYSNYLDVNDTLHFVVDEKYKLFKVIKKYSIEDKVAYKVNFGVKDIEYTLLNSSSEFEVGNYLELVKK